MSIFSVPFRRGLVVWLICLATVQGLSAQTDLSPSLTGAATRSSASKLTAETLGADRPDWYKDQIFYQVWIPAFNHASTGESDTGTEGNLKGILAKLDYLQDLGVTALWLSPFWDSASTARNRHNYDAVNHYLVHPALGTNADLAALVTAVHERGMHIILDYVPNHVSIGHPWFQDSKSGKNGRQDWFVWKPQKPTGWQGFSGRSNWYGPYSSGWYYSVFDRSMADLNYRNPEVRQAMQDVYTYWLDFGFDGMRVDAVRYLFEDLNSNGSGYLDQPETLAYFQDVRRVLDGYAKKQDSSGRPLYKFMVAENWNDDREMILKYMADSAQPAQPGFHESLDFPFAAMIGRLDGPSLNEYFLWEQTKVIPVGGWMATFLSNHDNFASRPATAIDDPAKLKLVTAFQFFAPGMPIVYYGNEIGMPGEAGIDTNLRQPFDWKKEAEERADPGSLLNWERSAIALHEQRPSLRRGDYEPLTVAGQSRVLAFIRSTGKERSLVVANLGKSSTPDLKIDLGDGAPKDVSVLFGTDGATISGSALTVKALGPFAVRVIALGEKNLRPAQAPQDVVAAGATSGPAPTEYVSADGFHTLLKAPHLRGEWDKWGPGTAMKLVADYTWQLAGVPLKETAILAKINDGNLWLGWGPGSDVGLNLDPQNDPSITVESDKSQYQNLKLTTTEPGPYTFTFHEKTQTLTITKTK